MNPTPSQALTGPIIGEPSLKEPAYTSPGCADPECALAVAQQRANSIPGQPILGTVIPKGFTGPLVEPIPVGADPHAAKRILVDHHDHGRHRPAGESGQAALVQQQQVLAGRNPEPALRIFRERPDGSRIPFREAGVG